MEGTIAAPWFWRGNTDHDGDVELRGYKPGAGQVDVLRTCQQTLNDAQLGAEWDKADRNDGLGAYISREDYIEQRRDNPHRHLAFGRPDAMFVEFGRELAVYEVARNQGLPDDTPRDHERVYRADVVDVRNPNARFIAAARSLVPDLVDMVEELQAIVDADDSTAARIHRQWTQTRRRIKEIRSLCSVPFDTLEVESAAGCVQTNAVVRVSDVLAILNGDGEVAR